MCHYNIYYHENWHSIYTVYSILPLKMSAIKIVSNVYVYRIEILLVLVFNLSSYKINWQNPLFTMKLWSLLNTSWIGAHEYRWKHIIIHPILYSVSFSGDYTYTGSQIATSGPWKLFFDQHPLIYLSICETRQLKGKKWEKKLLLENINILWGLNQHKSTYHRYIAAI